MNKHRGLVKGTIIAKKAGQKARISRHYNALIEIALNAGNTRKAAAYKAHKTMKHREIADA
jgi:hypothetical protein